MIFHEEYARAGAPARVSHIGEELLGPTLIAFGTDEQQQRFLPGIHTVTELWCQGYSEPGAGSDLASVSTRARLAGGSWVVDGQKVWTSLAHVADWCFVVARTEAGSRRHAGLSYLLVPMDQPGVEVRPIRQLTGTSSSTRSPSTVPAPRPPWWSGSPVRAGRSRWARSGSRGATVGQQVGFAREVDGVVAMARANGTIEDPVIRDRIVRARMGLDVMRLHALRTLAGSGTGSEGPEA